jgi:ABC-2 type transport system ATP-binding protein
MIRVENLTKTYRRMMGERVRALDRVSLEIKPGEAFGIIGPNGAGKTTFLGCLLGFLRPDVGRITVDGLEPDDLAVRSVTGYLPERLVMDRWMTGLRFMLYHHSLARLSKAKRREEAEAALERVGLDRESARRPIRKYSRGMLQRLGLAQALLGKPRYVFLDEPASGVDPAGVLLFRRLLGDLKNAKVTLVLNSHQLDQVERVCDRVAFVNKGQVEAIETVTAGHEMARVLRVRWARGTVTTKQHLEWAAREAEAELLQHDEYQARFSAADDAGAARLVQALIAAHVHVAEIAPEESRLERLFAGTAAERQAAAPSDPKRFAPPAAPARGAGS